MKENCLERPDWWKWDVTMYSCIGWDVDNVNLQLELHFSEFVLFKCHKEVSENKENLFLPIPYNML